MLPRLLIIDDLFGRNLATGRNLERENLCAHFLWQDVTGDAATKASHQRVLKPTAEVVFCRAQTPDCAVVGDVVENSVKLALDTVRRGMESASSTGIVNPQATWAMILLDLCFYSGRVTEKSHRRTPGMPEGRPGDGNERSYFGKMLAAAIRREYPWLPIVALSSKPRNTVILDLLEQGFKGFIARDDSRAPELLQESLRQHGLLPDDTEEVVGNSKPLLLLLRDARHAASHRDNLLIRGERGTGKEVLARYVHRVSRRSTLSNGHKPLEEPPFVAINSAVFTPNLFASELFGIQAKTATGVDAKIGLIEKGNYGDVFLDEIGDMPAEVQAAMLRVLQDHEIMPVGARNPKRVEVRFLSATNAKLEDPVYGFREDLLDRLRIGGELEVPPLRERLTDIPLLANRFVREVEQQRSGAMQRQITPEALDALGNHDWPGNIRELRTVIFDAVNRHPDVEHLVTGHLRINLRRAVSTDVRKSQPPDEAFEHPEPMPTDSEGFNQEAFPQLLKAIAQFEFRASDVEAWAGKFNQLQSGFAHMLAAYIKAAVQANRRPVPGNPKGQILIHPAMKLLTGDRKLTASKAADLIKRCLNLSPGDRDEILKDDVLREVHEIAVRLRPTSGQRKPGAGQEPVT